VVKHTGLLVARILPALLKDSPKTMGAEVMVGMTRKRRLDLTPKRFPPTLRGL
jgi:hypothetical protein